MADRHYDDEALISFLEAGDPDAASRDPHLRTCTACTDTLTTLHTLAATMKLEDVWAPCPVSDASAATLSTLRSFADQMSREDTAADAILRGLLAQPRETWMPQVEANPGWRTGGMVRRVLAAAERTVSVEPGQAFALAHLALHVLTALDPAQVTEQLRAMTLRICAFTSFYVGDLTAANDYLQQADFVVAMLPAAEYERARLAVTRSLVYRAMERTTEARTLTTVAATTFRSFGDERRLGSARSAEASMHFSEGKYPLALSIWLDLEKAASDRGDASELVRILPNVGACYRELGNMERAVAYFSAAADLWRELGSEAEAARVRANVAVLLLRNGFADRALAEFRSVRTAFEQHEMLLEAAMASLDMAEILSMQQRFVELEESCRTAMHHLEGAGLAYSSAAMTALAYMSDAAKQLRVTPALVNSVKRYIRRLPEEPQLMFAALPRPD